MRNKTIDRCQSICNEIIMNPKWKHRLAYVIEALNQERHKNNLRRMAMEQAQERKEENGKKE